MHATRERASPLHASRFERAYSSSCARRHLVQCRIDAVCAEVERAVADCGPSLWCVLRHLELRLALPVHVTTACDTPSFLCAGVPELRDVETMHALDHHLKACRDCCVNGLGTRLRLQCLHPEIASGPSAPPFPFVTLTTRVGPSQLRPPQLDWEDQSAAGSNERPPAGMSSRPLGDGSIFGAGPMGEESADLVAVRAALERLLAAGPSAGDGSLPIDGAPPPLEAATSPTAGSQLESRPLPAGPTEPPAPPPSPEELLDAAVSWFGVHFSRVARVVAGRQRRRIVASGQSEDIYAAVWAEAATLYEARRGRERFPTPPRIAPPPTATGGTATGAGGNAVRAGAAAATDNEVWDADTGAASSEAEGVPLSSLLVLPPRADADADDALDFRKLLSSLTLGLAMLGLADRLHLSAIHPRDTFHMQTLDDGSRSWRTTLTVPIMHVVASAATDPSAAP